ncbi:MAG TPA: MotA/TolQ/ExbB proton channel family protein [Gammaproteobacteria bacterium]|nr:MotA/TolQ/ExbB proton channel family protein [Gammaproteobacteria bacterium]
MDTIYYCIKFFLDGGAFMYPILLVFAVGIAIAIERWFKLSSSMKRNRRTWDELQPVLQDGDFDRAREFTGKSDTELGMVLSLGLSRQGSVRRRDDIEIAMEEGMMEIIPQLEKRTPYLAILANVATLLGLLGTIVGLIQAFTAVANANPSEKANLLSGAIAVAMNTTAFGLMVGIPLLLMHTFLTAKTTEIVDSLEMAQVKTLNVITEFARQDTTTKGAANG